MVTFAEIERALQTYSLREILDVNDVTDEEVLYFLVKEEFLELPNPRPVDYDPH